MKVVLHARLAMASLLTLAACGSATPAPRRPALQVPVVAGRGDERPSLPPVQPPFPALVTYTVTEPIFSMLDDFRVALDANEVGLLVTKYSEGCIRFLRFRAPDLSMISKSGCFATPGPNVLGLVRTATRWLALLRDRSDNGSSSGGGTMRVVAFDDFGTRLSPVLRVDISVSPNVPEARFVSRPGGALVLHQEGESMRALLLDDEGRPGARFDLGPGGHAVLGSAWAGDGFLVARRGDPEDVYGRSLPIDAPIRVTYVPLTGGPARTTFHRLGSDVTSLDLVVLQGGPALVYRLRHTEEWILPLGAHGEADGGALELSAHPSNGLFGPVTSLGDLALFPQKDDGPAGPSPIAYGLVDRSGKTVAARVPIVAGRSTAQRAAIASYGRDAIIAWRSGETGERVGLAGFRARAPGLTVPADEGARRREQ
jgi:hypothetical protein